jgi:hypothetical protein
MASLIARRLTPSITLARPSPSMVMVMHSRLPVGAIALPCGHDMGQCTCNIRPSSSGNARWFSAPATATTSSSSSPVAPSGRSVSPARQQRIVEEQKVLKQACGEAVGK